MHLVLSLVLSLDILFVDVSHFALDRSVVGSSGASQLNQIYFFWILFEQAGSVLISRFLFGLSRTAVGFAYDFTIHA